MFEDASERRSGDGVVTEVIRELRELVDDLDLGILLQFVAGVVDLLDVRLGTRRADDVVGRVEGPLFEPVEPGLAHTLGEHGHAAAIHDARDGDAPSGVVARGGPHGSMSRRVEPSGDEPRNEARVRGQHLVGPDHRESVADRQQDAGLDAGHLRREFDVVGHLVGTAAIESTEPVHPEQVAGVGFVTIEAGQRGDAGCGDCRGVGQLGKGRERDVALLEPLHGAFVDALIRDLGGEAQRLVGPCDFSSVDHSL